eukprot:2854919-Amphidinium_carterae.4
METWERLVPEYDAQRKHAVPDSTKSGVDHLMLRSGRFEDYDKFRHEVFDVFCSRQQLGGPVLMQLDALHTPKRKGSLWVKAETRAEKGARTAA